jgi:hypothetical protein
MGSGIRMSAMAIDDMRQRRKYGRLDQMGMAV